MNANNLLISIVNFISKRWMSLISDILLRKGGKDSMGRVAKVGRNCNVEADVAYSGHNLLDMGWIWLALETIFSRGAG